MESLTIAWEYLTGYAVATDPTRRDRAEWPPHPARVFMALAAAWFETEPPASGDDSRDAWIAEGDALRWLETLGDPEIIVPAIDASAERTSVSFYVPVNDRPGPSAAMLQSCPAITRNKQARSFPRVWVGPSSCFLHWSSAGDAEGHRVALDRLCRKVTRIGHSSSLVSVRANVTDELSAQQSANHLVVDDLQAELQARSLSPGTLEMLSERFGEEPRQRHAALTKQIADLKGRKKSASGKGAKEVKAGTEEQIEKLEGELSSTASRPPVRPITGLWTGYRARRHESKLAVAHSLFDPDILILSQVAGPTLPIIATLAVTHALRETTLSRSAQPVPDWVSGHQPDGQALRNNDGHLAIIPLPFVGRAHADGHLLGVALAFPKSVSYKNRGQALGKLLVNDRGGPNDLQLRLGSLGIWTARKRDWEEPRTALQPAWWTAFPEGAHTWASVTPVVLDRFPKADRLDPKHRAAWEDEVRRIVSDACSRVRLPKPEVIDIDTSSWLLGSVRAVGKRRPLRAGAESPNRGDTALGDGFPPFPPKGTNAPRPQVHVWLRFHQPVVGPVVLGAGRYLGYGLCKPLKGRRP